jgi:hypothetical protein
MYLYDFVLPLYCCCSAVVQVLPEAPCELVEGLSCCCMCTSDFVAPLRPVLQHLTALVQMLPEAPHELAVAVTELLRVLLSLCIAFKC